MLLCVLSVKAQFGISFAPYLFSTAYMSELYDKTNGFGNNAFGFSLYGNFNNKAVIEYSHFRIYGENKKMYVQPYGDGVFAGFMHRNFRWNEFHVDYALKGTSWEEMKKRAPAVAVRLGFCGNTRMAMLSPQFGRDTLYQTTEPYTIDTIMYHNRYDMTAVRQKMLMVGLSGKILRRKEVRKKGAALSLNRLTMGAYRKTDQGQTVDNFERIRQWDFYADLLLAFSSQYDDYLGWGDYRNSAQTIRGADIPGRSWLGWRVGIKHVSYNLLGLQYLVEYQQLPGQKNNSAADARMDKPLLKNGYLLIGLTFSIGI
jgi:hypothetical protein